MQTEEDFVKQPSYFDFDFLTECLRLQRVQSAHSAANEQLHALKDQHQLFSFKMRFAENQKVPTSKYR